LIKIKTVKHDGVSAKFWGFFNDRVKEN